MSLLHEIRSQSEGVRKLMFGLSVFVTISIVGVIWFRSFENRIFALMNPSDEVQERFYAAKQSNDSLLADISGMFKSLRASIMTTFSSEDETKIVPKENSNPSGIVHPLPIQTDN